MLYIDASRYNNTAHRTGVENYSFYLLEALAKNYPEQITLLSPRRIDLPVAQRTLPCPRLWTHLRLSSHVFTHRLPNLFVPSHVFPLICPKKAAITLHDVAFRRFPQSYSLSSRLYLDWAARFAAKKAEVVLTPSQATKADLIEFYGFKENRIQVTPLGLNPAPEGLTPEKIKRQLRTWNLVEKQYFLYVGRLEHKKNTDTLLKAFAQFHTKYPEIPLVLAGFLGHGGKQIINQAPEETKKGLILTGYLGEQEKEALLAHALAFIFPSRYEGFGLPILEAMRHRLPILASNLPSSREILGDQGLFFETENAEQLAEQMEAILIHPEKAPILTQGYDRILENYTWEKCAEKTWEALKKIQKA